MSKSMREALETLVKYADWQIREGKDHHPTLPSAIGQARAALSSPAPDRLSEEERRDKVRQILDEMLMGTENYFGAADPKREGRIHIATAAIMKATR